MGSFANSVFSVLLGWIRTAVNECWNILSSGEGGGESGGTNPAASGTSGEGTTA